MSLITVKTCVDNLAYTVCSADQEHAAQVALAQVLQASAHRFA
jgi:hypothetical protein